MSAPHAANHQEAEKLSDPDYLSYCQDEARKLFEALASKRWPNLVRRRKSSVKGFQKSS